MIFGCSRTTQEKSNPVLTEKSLQEIVVKAINGNKVFNDSLSSLIDYSLPINTNYNELKAQRIISPSNKTLFTLILEYPNPVYNRFAIYDSAFHLILIDKSLNGRIRLKTFSMNNQQFIEVDESFISKDVLKLERVSLYSIEPKIPFYFRIFSKIKTPTNEILQTIADISYDTIKTKITSTKQSLINDKSDVFIYNANQRRYISPNQIFFNFIKKEIEKFKKTSDKPEITDERSLMQSLGVKNTSDTLTSAVFANNKPGYYLPFDDTWKEVKDLRLSGLAIRLIGNKYYNPKMGTNIFIAELTDGNSAEVFTKTGLRNIIQGKYKVRYSDKIMQGKYYIQYFEFSCGTRKYLMIFEASKYTYEKYKDTYQEIINSFIMDC